eukprot:1184086-Prorocentrum_minimum.AAC.1
MFLLKLSRVLLQRPQKRRSFRAHGPGLLFRATERGRAVDTGSGPIDSGREVAPALPWARHIVPGPGKQWLRIRYAASQLLYPP